MDITSLFKASVKTVRLKSSSSFSVPNKSRILVRKSKNEFSEKAKKIRFQITQMKNLLLENRAAYMQLAFHLKKSAQMSDEERDIIDHESDTIIRICTETINDLKTECRRSKQSKQITEFMELVIEILSSYMHAVHHIANEQRQFRIQRELESYRFLKLNSDRKSLSMAAPKMDNDIEKPGKINMERITPDDVELTVKSLDTSKVSIISQDEERSFTLEDEELSPEDIQVSKNDFH